MAFYFAVLSVLILSGMNFTIAEVVECHSAGYFCGPTCKTLFHCIDLGQGDLVLETLLTCGSNEFCNIDTRSCSSKPDHCSKVQEIQCNDEGMFPSPYNCSMFFKCPASLIPATASCPDGQIFDPCKYLCTTGTCLCVPVPVCNRVFQSGAVPGTDNKFYVCNENLYPEQYSCGNDEVFDSDTENCIQMTSKCNP